MKSLESKGKCVFCEKEFSKKGITRHLTSHLKAIEKEKESSGTSFHIRIGVEEMFLELLIDGTMTFGHIDDFLRAIWLECCGHLSGFQIKGKDYSFDWETTDDFGEKMSAQVGKVFKKGMKIKYDYDFGSTTRLELKIMNSYKTPVEAGILLLSRNEPLPILCHECNEKPAISLCSIHIFEGAWMFCESCSEKHAESCYDFADYAKAFIINSPRMGVCGYQGGTIDIARDGVWKG